MQKQLEGTWKYINEQIEHVYRWATRAIIADTQYASAEYKCLK